MALNETIERAPAGVPVVTVADRESDFFEFLTHAQDLQAHYLIRARTDRKLVPERQRGLHADARGVERCPGMGEHDDRGSWQRQS